MDEKTTREVEEVGEVRCVENREKQYKNESQGKKRDKAHEEVGIFENSWRGIVESNWIAIAISLWRSLLLQSQSHLLGRSPSSDTL